MRRFAVAAALTALALAPATVLTALALAPATAQASAYTDVLHVYQSTGSIPPCSFSSSELENLQAGIEPVLW